MWKVGLIIDIFLCGLMLFEPFSRKGRRLRKNNFDISTMTVYLRSSGGRGGRSCMIVLYRWVSRIPTLRDHSQLKAVSQHGWRFIQIENFNEIQHLHFSWKWLLLIIFLLLKYWNTEILNLPVHSVSPL